MQCYTELIPPTAVTHAVALPFLTPHANNLVVAKTSLLQIFDIPNVASPTTAAVNGLPSITTTSSRLSLIASYPLSGTPTSLRSLSLPTTPTGAYALLVAFKDAKLSLLAWDPVNHRISTISIHYYEGENVVLPPFGPKLGGCESVLTVDPSSRCAALKFGAKGLAILPFRQQGDEGEGEEDGEEGFDEEMGDVPALKRTGTRQGGEGEATQTPYKASFVLPMTTLDPNLTHPVHLAFLHEYREPTFGILSSPQQPSIALLEERKDCLTYSAFTLDLEKRASTNLISVPKLPSDLCKVVPLALPVGGALLVGTNEFVHVDQNGKTSAVAVNEFAAKASGFSMADQSALNMKLEDCEIETLDVRAGDLLIVLNDASLATLSFKLLGRNVGGLTVTRVSAENGGLINSSAPSCVAALQDNNLFIGSEDGDSSLLHWHKDTTALSRKRSHAQMLDRDALPAPADDISPEDADDIDEDDLYAPTAETAKRTASAAHSQQNAVDAASTYRFEMRDQLRSLGPINDFCLGKGEKLGKEKLELVAGIGRGRGSRLAFMHREIVLDEVRVRRDVAAGARNVWSIRARAKGDARAGGDRVGDPLLFIYDGESTRAYRAQPEPDADADAATLKELTGTDFESESETLALSTLANNTIVVQARRSELRTYDSELGLSQIIPMGDEEAEDGAETNVIATSFCDPYVSVLKDDSRVMILKVDGEGEVEPLEADGVLGEEKWLSGCLYAGEMTGGDATLWLVNEEGGLQLFSLPGLKQVYAAPTLPFLPPVLAADAPPRRGGGKVTLTELLVADLGTEEVRRPYVVIRTSMDDLVLYEPFHYNTSTSTANSGTEVDGNGVFGDLRFRKVPSTYIPKCDEEIDTASGDGRPAPLRAVQVGGRRMIYLPGSAPSFIIKEPSSLPHVLGLRARGISRVKAFSPLPDGDNFLLVDPSGEVKEYAFPAVTSYETGWSVRTLPLRRGDGDGDGVVGEVRHVAFHEGRGVYVVGAWRGVDFEVGREEGDERGGGGAGEREDIALRPQIPQYSLHLLSASTHSIIQSLELPYTETITSLKILPLEVSEHTHDQRPMLAVGTACMCGEDLPAKGALTVFDIIDVVPEPERPESGIKLHAISREETKGAITALEGFGSCGLVGTAQGQKIMLRGLKEDGSCLPVAFLDAQTYITTLRTFGRSGLWLAGDAWKGLWFGGVVEEPYKLHTLGKSRTKMEVIAAEFLPFEGQLFVVFVDGAMDMHVLQYDPENAKMMSGQSLLHRGTFHLGHLPPTMGQGMMVLPSSLAPLGAQPVTTNGDGHAESEDGEAPSHLNEQRLFQVLMTFQSGAVGLLTPVDETTYRRLSALQTQLTALLEHAAGLNPRAYRAAEGEGRGVVDGSLVRRIGEPGAARRAEVLGRAGADGWMLRSDLEVIGGGGLGYL